MRMGRKQSHFAYQMLLAYVKDAILELPHLKLFKISCLKEFCDRIEMFI